MAVRERIEAERESLRAFWEAILETLPSWLSGPLDWLVQLSLRDLWHGTVWLWNWWIDAPLWISLPLAFAALVALAFAIVAIGILSEDQRA
jgi:hypothetical protein